MQDTEALPKSKNSDLTSANLLKNPLVIGGIVISLTYFWVLPMLSSNNEATHEQYRTLQLIAAGTQCDATKSGIRQALGDGILTQQEFAKIAGHSTSVGCDRDPVVADILQSLD